MRIQKSAIILAAGFGMRSIPINIDIPKGLIKVHGERLIERLISQLKNQGIDDIVIVIGYMSEKYLYLEEEYNVHLIVNSEFAEKNSLHSLWLAKDYISNSYILPCDVWIKDNIFDNTLSESCCYLSAAAENSDTGDTKEQWDNLLGIAYINENDSEYFSKMLEKLEHITGSEKLFWEEILYCSNKLNLKKIIDQKATVIEIDTFEDLRKFDSESPQLNADSVNYICSILNVEVSDIYNIKAMKKGMTNRSFFFESHHQKYIMRIPGEGTDLLINRKSEASVYNTIAPYLLSDELISIDENSGYKITKFISDTRTCDPKNNKDLELCIKKLKSFHQLELIVDHEFDLFDQINFYEQINSNQSVYPNYDDVKKTIFSLKSFIEDNVERKCLTHIDAVSDNFLIYQEAEQLVVKLIDWEYAAMQDPHLDLAMFAIYSSYSRIELDKLINLYFDNQCETNIRYKIYAYVAVAGLLWSNWCEYKSSLGVEFGEYAVLQFEYATLYSKIVKEYLAYEIKGKGG
ncbi:phosphotransferase [Streptococcus sp. S784/96/1]|uniref:phosphotransferase n=1 Tax=Streptococcus sp. S784/96/1 TaxID=2653499 RepID=UPI001389E364|nr:NTP transferase domain-containing protein [Streptococcus sp. S784/96/1]